MLPATVTLDPTPAVTYELLHPSPTTPIALVTLHHPPVNALGHPLRAGLLAALDAARTHAVSAFVVVAAGRTFPAGADISEFANGKAMASPTLTEVIAALDDPQLPFVTLAALHGTAFGGGLELALAMHYRIAVPGTKMGLPEVGLGLLPGAGGTQRLPRVIGLVAAAKAITTGAPFSADAALANGILDAVLDDVGSPDALPAAAVDYAVGLTAAHKHAPATLTRRISQWAVPQPASRAVIAAIKEKTAAASRGFLAPVVIVDAIAGVLEDSFAAGLQIEQDGFIKLFTSTQARAMQAFFFAERKAAKVPGLDAAAPRPIHTIGIVGAGTMGSGIALAALKSKRAAIHVTLLDISPEMLDKAAARVAKYMDSRVAKGRLTAAAAADGLARITYTSDYSALSQVDMVIEAVYENLSLKKKIFAQLDAVCKPDAILASNTSTLDIDAIAGSTSRPGSVVGTHFFAPAHVMPLLENIRGSASSPTALATAMSLAKSLGKKAIMVGNCPGFVANRIFAPYFNEAGFLVEEGVAYPKVDAVALAFGLPMGPFQTADLSGLDIAAAIRKEGSYLTDPSARVAAFSDALVDIGRLGQKSGAGWYSYASSKTGEVDPVVEAMVADHRASLPPSTGAGAPALDSDDAILMRLLIPIVLEALRCLQEGIAIRASDIDVAAVYGYGWPRYWCGPMWWAENELGWDDVLDIANSFSALWDGQSHLRPPALLLELVDKDITLKEWANSRKSKL